MTSQLDRLREQLTDVAFVMLPVQDKFLQTRLLLRDPLVVVAPVGHP